MIDPARRVRTNSAGRATPLEQGGERGDALLEGGVVHDLGHRGAAVIPSAPRPARTALRWPTRDPPAFPRRTRTRARGARARHGRRAPFAPAPAAARTLRARKARGGARSREGAQQPWMPALFQQVLAVPRGTSPRRASPAIPSRRNGRAAHGSSTSFTARSASHGAAAKLRTTSPGARGASTSAEQKGRSAIQRLASSSARCRPGSSGARTDLDAHLASVAERRLIFSPRYR